MPQYLHYFLQSVVVNNTFSVKIKSSLSVKSKAHLSEESQSVSGNQDAHQIP